MNRSDCWLTFSEALNMWFDAKKAVAHFGPGRNRDNSLADVKIAEDHMDALTALPVTKVVKQKS